jgi:ABC-type glycerol-3-phosphate transport system substrate-binding protein
MRFRKKGFLCLFILFLVVALSAFAGGDQESAAGKTTITFWHHSFPSAINWMRTKIEEYESLHPDIDIELIEYPHGDYEVKLLSAISAGNAPDILNLLDYLFPKYISKGLLAPVNLESYGAGNYDELRNLFMDNALDGMSDKGKVYGVPAEFNTYSLFFNTKHFIDAGIDPYDEANWPKTWDDLFALADKLTIRDKNGEIVRSGFNWVWGLDHAWYCQQYWPVIRQYGGNIVDKEGNVVINSPKVVQAFEETWVRLIKDNIGGPNLGNRNAINAVQDFADGKQSICYAGPWAPSNWVDLPEINENYISVPLPQKDPQHPVTLLQSYAIGVSSSSKHQKEAWDFLNFLTSDTDGLFAAAGYITCRKGWQDVPSVKESKFMPAFVHDYAYGQYVWSSPTFTEESEAVKKAIENFSSGRMSVQDAFNQCAEEIRLIRKK